jgi:hypothetical protein
MHDRIKIKPTTTLSAATACNDSNFGVKFDKAPRKASTITRWRQITNRGKNIPTPCKSFLSDPS